MFSKSCGKEIADGARFCDECGASVSRARQGAVGNENQTASGAGLPAGMTVDETGTCHWSYAYDLWKDPEGLVILFKGKGMKDMTGDQKKNRGKRILRRAFFLIVFLLVLFAASPISSRADFGDFAGDTDYGGGGGGSSWGGDSYDDSDSDGGTDLIELIFGEEVAEVVHIIIALIMWGFLTYVFIRWLIRKIRGGHGTRSAGGQPVGAEETPQYMLSPMEEYGELDPGFNEAALREHLSNLYIQMQQRWHEKNIESLKPYFTDAFYNQSEMQLEQKRRDQQTPCTERVAVLEVTPRGFYQSEEGLGENNGMDHIVVRIRARLVAYILDDKTDKVISGDRSREKFMTYEWDICRRSGVTTMPAGGMQSVSCPHCGAPLNINQTAKCPYCDSVVTLVNEDWALNNIKGISQQTL